MTTTTSRSHHHYISQEYFDELCLENHELFNEGDKSDVDDAVQETIAQLQGTGVSLGHISCTFPTSDNRTTIRQFHQALEERDGLALMGFLDESSSSSSSSSPAAAAATTTGAPTTLFRHLFLVHDGFVKLCESFAAAKSNDESAACNTTTAATTTNHQVQLLTCLDRSYYCPAASPAASAIEQHNNNGNNDKFRTAFQAAAPQLIPQWLTSYRRLWCCEQQREQRQRRETSTGPDDDDAEYQQQIEPLLLLYWTICYKSIYRCEANKKLWMKQEAFPPLLMDALLLLAQQQQEEESSSSASSSSSLRLTGTIVCCCCRVLTCLCTFDDFANADLVQSYHQTVQILATPRTIETLHGMILVHNEHIKDNNDDDDAGTKRSNLTIPALQALRAMAVQDHVVVRMMEAGILATAVALFVTTVTTSSSSSSSSISDQKDNVALLTALLGLFRNLSANDVAKQQLCQRETVTALQGAGTVLAPSREAVDHALAWMAAMALRSPQNASFLLSIAIHETILAWMLAHPDAAPVQRSGALALRNLASRGTREEKALLLTECREVLMGVAARHFDCQDQVYAALRDMGAKNVTESIVHVETALDGSAVVRVSKAEQFGEGHNANFRPVFDD